jgi:hypothetical protein
MTGAPARICALVVLCALAACGSQPARLSYAPERGSYPVPGTPEDPWGPYIEEASSRFNVPSGWIRAVMHQESGGNEYLDGQPITSGAGAMGLMQLMPSTYSDLQSQYGLGGDPYDPHDNILAGTAYIRQMYDKYGSPGFLAAYNAGPARVDDYLAGASDLPSETVNYVAAITPHLNDDAPAVEVAEAPVREEPAPATEPTVRATRDAACWHDPDSAYDPDAPCQSPLVIEQLAPEQAAEPATRPVIQTAAYVPAPTAIGSFRTPPPPSGMAPAVPPPAASGPPAWAARPPVIRAAYVSPPPLHHAGGIWAVQVGAFGRPDEAALAAAVARRAAPATLAASRSEVTAVSGLGAHPLYRARLAGLDQEAASDACASLRHQAMACMLVPP